MSTPPNNLILLPFECEINHVNNTEMNNNNAVKITFPTPL